MSNRMIVARDAWGHDLPDWIAALVLACDAPGSSQNKVAARLGISAAVVSQTLRNDYAGNMGRIEARVRSVYLDDNVNCPALGSISAEACMSWRDRSKVLSSAAPNRVRMFRACRACPRFPRDGEE